MLSVISFEKTPAIRINVCSQQQKHYCALMLLYLIYILLYIFLGFRAWLIAEEYYCLLPSLQWKPQ